MADKGRDKRGRDEDRTIPGERQDKEVEKGNFPQASTSGSVSSARRDQYTGKSLKSRVKPKKPPVKIDPKKIREELCAAFSQIVRLQPEVSAKIQAAFSLDGQYRGYSRASGQIDFTAAVKEMSHNSSAVFKATVNIRIPRVVDDDGIVAGDGERLHNFDRMNDALAAGGDAAAAAAADDDGDGGGGGDDDDDDDDDDSWMSDSFTDDEEEVMEEEEEEKKEEEKRNEKKRDGNCGSNAAEVSEKSQTESISRQTTENNQKFAASSDQQQHKGATCSLSEDIKGNVPPASESTEGRDDNTNTAGLSRHQQHGDGSESHSHREENKPSFARPSLAQPEAKPNSKLEKKTLKQICGKMFLDSGCGTSLLSFVSVAMSYFPDWHTLLDWIDDVLSNSLIALANYAECCDGVKSCVLRHEGSLSALVKPVKLWCDQPEKCGMTLKTRILEGCLALLYCLTQHPDGLMKLRDLKLIPSVLCYSWSPKVSLRSVSLLLVSGLLTEEEAREMELTESQVMSLLEKVLQGKRRVSRFIANNSAMSVAKAVQKFSLNTQNELSFFNIARRERRLRDILSLCRSCKL